MASLDSRRRRTSVARIPVTASITRSLCARDVCEVWRVASPEVQLSSGSAQARVRSRYAADLLFGSLTIAKRAIMINIGALLEDANRVVGSNRSSLDGLKLKVYLRHPSDSPAIEATV